MSGPIRTSSQESADSLRKRVCKACDRCRLKKSKCDGSNPCSRCKADNSICVFGERKKSHDKVYPKGYVEMLEQQQNQLVAALQNTYQRLQSAQLWPGPPLQETDGHVLTHDILTRLDIINKPDSESDAFEEHVDKLQQRLLTQGASFINRRRSTSLESDHSHRQSHSRSRSHDSPVSSPVQPMFKQDFAIDTVTSSPLGQIPNLHNAQSHSAKIPSPLHIESPIEDDMTMDDDLYLGSWQDLGYDGNASDVVNSQFNLQGPAMQDNNVQSRFDNWQVFDPTSIHYDAGLMAPFQLQPPRAMQDCLINEAMDVDFSKFVQVVAQ